MEIKLSVDRIESGIAVCYDQGDKKYEISADGLAEGLIISAEFDESGNFISAKPLYEETEALRGEIASRTRALFKRNKK